MLQLFQSLKNGQVSVVDTPVPGCGPKQVRVRAVSSLISLGTEKMLIEFGQSSWIKKAQQQPEKVQQVIQKMKTDGVKATVETVLNKLDQPIALGYSSFGIIESVGSEVRHFKVGDRVVTNGPHAEFVVVGENLCCLVPDNVSADEASFAVVGAIALQGVRLVNPTLGETVVVVGLGLIGLLTVQILRANGCRVIAFDFEENKVAQAKQYGAIAFQVHESYDSVKVVQELTDGFGADAVIITASTSSQQVISDSAQMCRVRGRVVLVGVVGLNLKRSDFFEKEINFQVSCSYGPGRYQSGYEEKGIDYPIGYVRWTENRNFSAVLNLLAEGKLSVQHLISKRITQTEAVSFYESHISDKDLLGVVIEYSQEAKLSSTVAVATKQERDLSLPANNPEPVFSVLGAGQFSNAVLIPAMNQLNWKLKHIASRSSVHLANWASKYKFVLATSNYDEIFQDKDVNSVVITSRHNSHAALVEKALLSDKNVFVEKPLALKLEDLDSIKNLVEKSKKVLTVGFNRRFAPSSQAIKQTLLKMPQAKVFIYTVNAGAIPANHWTQDPQVGGGRLVGEGCHFIDLLRYFSGSKIVTANVISMKSESRDSYSISLSFENGDIGTIHYLANGHKGFPKERVEIFCGQRIITLDNFKSVTGLGFKSVLFKLSSQDKGHKNELRAFYDSVKSGQPPIPMDEIFDVSRCAIKLQSEVYN